jgi:phage protein U
VFGAVETDGDELLPQDALAHFGEDTVENITINNVLYPGQTWNLSKLQLIKKFAMFGRKHSDGNETTTHLKLLLFIS